MAEEIPVGYYDICISLTSSRFGNLTNAMSVEERPWKACVNMFSKCNSNHIEKVGETPRCVSLRCDIGMIFATNGENTTVAVWLLE